MEQGEESLVGFVTDDGDKDTAAGSAAQVVRQREMRIGQLPLTCLARSWSHASNSIRRPLAPTGLAERFPPPSMLTGRRASASNSPVRTSSRLGLGR